MALFDDLLGAAATGYGFYKQEELERIENRSQRRNDEARLLEAEAKLEATRQQSRVAQITADTVKTAAKIFAVAASVIAVVAFIFPQGKKG